MSRVSRALWANAIFSTCCGLFCALSPTRVASWLGTVPSAEVFIVGVSLLGFAGFVAVVARGPRPAPGRVLAISAADLGWVLGTAPLLWLARDVLSGLGFGILLAVAVVVGGLALAQLRGLAAQYRHPDPRGPFTHRLCIEVQSAAPAPTLWRALSDLPAIARYADNLRESVLVEGGEPGVGATRRCVDARGQAWTETCIAWDPGRAFTLRFNADADDFPFPVRGMIGGWTVTPSPRGTTVRAWWDFSPNRPRWGGVFAVTMAILMPKTVTRLVTAMGDGAAPVSRWRFGARTAPC